MATLADLRTRTREIIRETSTDAADTHFPNADGLDSFINQSVEFLGSLIEYPRTFQEIQAVSGQGNYSVGVTSYRVISIISAYFGDKTIKGDISPLDFFKEETLKTFNPSWLETVDNGNGRPARIILKDRDTIWCDPKPSAAESATGKKFHINYSYVPATLSSASDVPDLPNPYHNIIPFRAAYFALIALNKIDAAKEFDSQFDKKRKELQSVATKESDQNIGWQFADGEPY